MARTISLGSLSHGTMREADLLPVFLDFLRTHDREEYENLTSAWREEVREIEAGDVEVWCEEHPIEAGDLVSDLFNSLDHIAPEGSYFGSHPGDGSDYGFWSVEEG